MYKPKPRSTGGIVPLVNSGLAAIRKLFNVRFGLAFLILLAVLASGIVDYNQTKAAEGRYNSLQSEHTQTIKDNLESQKKLETQIQQLNKKIDQKDASQKDLQDQVDKLKERVSAKEEAARIAAARTGGIGGNYSAPTAVRGPTHGNTYTYGYCTWYVKNRRPDIPNNWGNAYEWWGNAVAQGWPTGTTPRAGAIGQAGNHVVYVEHVNKDGSVHISEMNYEGWNIRSERDVSPTTFRYIY